MAKESSRRLPPAPAASCPARSPRAPRRRRSWRYQDFFESAPDAYLVTNLDGTVQECHHGLPPRPEHFLQKPFPPATLLAAVRRVLDGD